jgi:hypothetical protein
VHSRSDAVLNLVITHSPRIAAIATGKRFGDDSMRDPALMHRLAWLRKERKPELHIETTPVEQPLRERTA